MQCIERIDYLQKSKSNNWKKKSVKYTVNRFLLLGWHLEPPTVSVVIQVNTIQYEITLHIIISALLTFNDRNS